MRTPSVALLAILLSFTFTGLSSPVLADGGDLVWTFQGIEDIECMDEIEDQNSDGVPDVLVETYDAGASGDHLYCLSGGAPGPVAATIWSAHPPGGVSSGGGDGDRCLQTVEDISGDGIQDVLLGTAWGGRTAYGINGTNGAVLWDFDTYVDNPPFPAESGWVYSVSSIPDGNDDGVPDVFFACGSDNNHAYHVSGADGSVLWSIVLGDAGYATAALDDVSSDGIGDVVVGVGDNADGVWCYRGGPTLVPLLWGHPMPGSVLSVARIADLTGDSINDVLVGTWDSSVFAFNGATGDTIWESNIPGFALVMRIAVLDDVNADGYQDAAIGSWDDRAFVLSGIDGTEIWSKPTGGDVWAISRVADVNHDGVNDVVAGSFDENVYALNGATGAELWSFATGDRLYYVQGVSDLTDNGAPDVVAGTQMLSGPPGGRAHLLEGGDDGAVPADLPVLVSGRVVAAGVEIELANAGSFDRCFVERSEGSSTDRAAAVRFRRDLVAAYRTGELTAAEAIRARTQDPHIKWSRLTSSALDLTAGSATYLDRTAVDGVTYTYRFAFVSGATVLAYSPVATVTASGAGLAAIPPVRVRPNPASGPVAIEFRIPESQPIRLDAYDVSGRRVAQIDARTGAVGDVAIEWDARDESGAPLPNGVYFLRLEGRDFVATEKLALVR